MKKLLLLSLIVASCTAEEEYEVIPDNDSIVVESSFELGRELFYDKELSFDNTISCASCHVQANAFGDPNRFSEGVNGITDRQSMRITHIDINAPKFWDGRSKNLKEQSTQPIKNMIEMGWNEDTIEDLIDKLQPKYQGITEDIIQNALVDFMQEIKAYDSRYDEGLENNFSNFNGLELRGMEQFANNCATCHSSIDFTPKDLAHNGLDEEITSAPSLRNLFDLNGNLLTPMMADGSFVDIEKVVSHYNEIFSPTVEEMEVVSRDAIPAFLKTLTSKTLLTDKRFSDPNK